MGSDEIPYDQDDRKHEEEQAMHEVRRLHGINLVDHIECSQHNGRPDQDDRDRDGSARYTHRRNR